MKVKELIELLQEANPESDVIFEHEDDRASYSLDDTDARGSFFMLISKD